MQARWTSPAALLAAATLVLPGCTTTSPAPGQDEPVFYPGPPDPPRIQFLRSVSRAADIEPSRSGLDRLLFGAPRDDEKPILRPFGIAVRDRIIYLTDTRLGAILRLDLAGRKLDLVPLRGRAAVRTPMSLCFGPEGEVYVADRGRRQVVVLDPDFRYLREYGPWGEKCTPVDVETWQDRLYVVDSAATCVRVLDRATGKELFVLGNADSRDEWMRGPTSIAVDENGNAYVVDTVYSRVYVWDADGRFVRHIGSPGDVVGQFARPKGIACSGRTLWVLDAAFENCQVFDLDGRPLMFFGGSGGGPGNMYLPAEIWIGTDGLDLFQDVVDADFVPEKLVIVTNQFGPRKVSFYAFGRSKKFRYPETTLPAMPSRQASSPPKAKE